MQDVRTEPQSDSVNAAPIACPNCRQPMPFRDLERNDRGTVRVDLCFQCAGIWFDKLGSVQLAPSGVIELFKEIHAQQKSSPQPVAPHLSCPRCEGPLELGYDLVKTGRFSDFRCLRGDGRFTPFMQFLREKQFVRDLTQAELQKIRTQVRQILPAPSAVRPSTWSTIPAVDIVMRRSRSLTGTPSGKRWHHGLRRRTVAVQPPRVSPSRTRSGWSPRIPRSAPQHWAPVSSVPRI